MKRQHPCLSAEHLMARRQLLGSLAGLGVAATGMPSLYVSAFGQELQRQRKQMLIVYLDGGVSQLESWDPKPGTDTGGPFLAIPTSLPGVHISELLPYTAQQMHRLSLIRSINTRENNHARGKYLMTRGRRQEQTTDYPHLGAVTAKMLSSAESLPGFIHLESGRVLGGNPSPGGQDAAYLGPRYASVVIDDGRPPKNTRRPQGLSAQADQARRAFRRRLNQRFSQRRSAATEAYTYSFEQAAQLMKQRVIFDVSRESQQDQARYGQQGFARNCLLARRLLEHGITCVKLTHSNYDTHNENFNFHLEQLGEFDRPFATLLDDLAQRGLLEHTLVIVMSEFGRTPQINQKLGRDHWGTAWSIALAGCGIQTGAVIGKTNKNGTAVADHEVDHGRLFHTFLQAVGIDSSSHFAVGGRPIPVADPAASPIEELLT